MSFEVSRGEVFGFLALVGMAPWTGISVGVDARGPVSGELCRRIGVFRYTGSPRAVTYTPGALAVSAAVVDRLTADALTRAD